MNYQESLQYLDSHINKESYRLPIAGSTDSFSLDGIRQLLFSLGDPHRSFRVIHVTGTNGKGSTSVFISSIISATDLSVGLYTSPHLESVTERLQWNGQKISEEDFARIISLIASIEPMVEAELSWFEILTAAAFVWFSELSVDVAVVEVGLLGLNDATNVVEADVAVITTLAKDHTDGLGDWQNKVAVEKAGIIKPSSYVLLGDDFGEQTKVFESMPNIGVYQAHEDFSVDSNLASVGGRLLDIRTINKEYTDLFFPFHAPFQAENFSIALAAVEAFFQRGLEQDIIEFALTTVALPARLEIVSTRPILVLDGCHNPAGAKASAHALSETFAKLGSSILIVGILQDRDPIEMLQAMNVADFDAVICCQPESDRALAAEKLVDAANSLGIQPELIRSPLEALSRAQAISAEEDIIYIAGSFYLVGHIRSFLIKSQNIGSETI